MQLEVQQFLLSNSLEKLTEKFGIVARRHSKYKNLVCLKYNQIESPMAERIVQECRGIILDETNNWKIVSRPFDKFFNINESLAAPIDWSSIRCFEKLDGSLMTIYYYDDRWHVQSSGTADASGSLSKQMLDWHEDGEVITPFPKDFADYFWSIAVRNGMSIHPLMNDVPKNHCFMFEMMGPLNRIIVKHNNSKIVLIGARDLNSGKELHLGEAAKLLPGKIEIAKLYSLSNLDEIISSLDKMNPICQEGYILVDNQHLRAKAKCPAYVALHHAKGEEVTTKRLLAIAVAGESDEWVAHFEEYKAPLNEVRQKLNNLISEIEKDYERITAWVGPHGSQKEFALVAVKSTCPAALFNYRSGKCESIRKFVREIQVDKLIDLLYK